MANGSSKIEILGLGCVAVDDLLYVEQYPPPESKVLVTHRERQCGGLTGTALVAAARLGSRCAYAGRLGDDEASQFVRSTLAREGVDLSYLRRDPDISPIHSTVIVDTSTRTRTVLADIRRAAGASIDCPAEEVIRSTRVLYVDHYGIEGMIRAAMIARAAGIGVVADLERDDWPGFHELLALVDHLIVPREFAWKLTGRQDPATAVQALWTDQRAVVVVTCGADGCYFRSAGEDAVHHHPAFAVEVVDSTGCGDVFHGAYASALARGLAAKERIRFASAAAALKATQPGGQAGIPNWPAVMQFLQRA